MFKKAIHFLKSYLLEGILLLIVVGFLFVQHLEVANIVEILVSYILLVLLINDTFLVKGLKKGMGDIKKERWYWLLILIFVALLAIWQFSLESIIFLTLFVSFALYSWDSRIVATGALISLASCPILLIAKKDAYAEQMAVYAYYFLVITVILQIIEYKRHPELFKDDQDEEKV